MFVFLLFDALLLVCRFDLLVCWLRRWLDSSNTRLLALLACVFASLLDRLLARSLARCACVCYLEELLSSSEMLETFTMRI